MEFIGDLARKTGDLSLLAVEATKTQLASEIGKDCGLFYVPKVINLNEEKGILDCERIDGLVPLLNLVGRKDPRLFSLLKKTGLALAIIHKELVLPAEMKVNLPDNLMVGQDNVFIHGDLTLGNVCFDESSDRLVIVDWSAAPFFEGQPTFGMRYFDIFWFMTSIFCAPPIKTILYWDGKEMANKFIRGYAESASGRKLDRLMDYSLVMRQLHKKFIWFLFRCQSRHSRLEAITHLFFRIFMYGQLCAFLRKYGE